jgi:RNA polymerase sigma factor (sigma-70 family)
MMAALRELPKGQRAVVVLRYFGDLSVEATAAALGCSVGTVKSQCARGLAALRVVLEAPSRVTTTKEAEGRA